MTRIGVAVVGFGFMGRTHAAAVVHARQSGLPCELRAICSSQPVPSEAMTDALGRPVPFDPADIPLTGRFAEVLADPDITAICICTYTDTHVPLTLRALAAGKHVLVEKPVALSSEALEPLVAAARIADRLCVPALCMRHWPGWPWLRNHIRNGTFGAVQSATFRRRTNMPAWTAFYADYARSGGALFDLHIHDADFVRWCFGEPGTVSATGDLRCIDTRYTFDDTNVEVRAIGEWVEEPDFGFEMTYEVRFENATARFDVRRDSPLTVERAGPVENVSLPAESAYDVQAQDFIKAIVDRRSTRATLDDALAVTRLLEAEAQSARFNAPVAVPASRADGLLS